MDRKERIFNYISSPEYVPLKFGELCVVLDVPSESTVELSKILDSLAFEGKIYKTKKGRYCPVSENDRLIAGTLMCNSGGYGFVRCDDSHEDIYIPFEKIGKAFDRDRVLVRVDKGTAEGHREGCITGIIERGNSVVVGVVFAKRKGIYMLSPDRREFLSDIRITNLNGAEAGDRAAVMIESYNEKGRPSGSISAVLGSGESTKGCLDGIIADNSIPFEFPEEVSAYADTLPKTVSDEDAASREDLRGKTIFTIDGENSRDFDDAVSLEKTKSGNMLLGVHIADVTHYVKEGSLLDKEALKRGTSVYFPDRVIPMLPKSLSNGICSLNPDVDRLTLSVFMELDGEGNIINSRLSETIIHSSARMTYNNVNKILDGDADLREKYDFIVPVLEEMDALAQKLSHKRQKRGSIDFDFPEAKIICDDKSEPIEITIEERGRSHRLIEEFMLAANETVAETAFWAELPFVYRVHDAPGTDKLKAFNDFIKNFGYSLKGKVDSESIHPKDLRTITQRAKGTPQEQMISKIMLRSLMKACYRDTNDGHFGLAARYYCHFTSPIRRYPDLMIHRILKDFLSGRLGEEKQQHYAPIVKEAAEVSSDREIAAQTAERDAEDMLKAAYMCRFIGESFEGIISSVTSFGIFVMLENTCEGLVRYESISEDYFEYDENQHTASGIRTGKVYKIGDKVNITVAAADPIRRRIDFVFEGDNAGAAIRHIERREKKTQQLRDKKLRKPSKGTGKHAKDSKRRKKFKNHE